MTHAALIQPVVINQSDVKVDNVFIENDFIYIIFVVSRLKVFPCSIHFKRPQNEPFNDHDRQARQGNFNLHLHLYHSVKQTSILLHTSIHISHGHSFFKIRIGVEVILFYNYLLTVCIT